MTAYCWADSRRLLRVQVAMPLGRKNPERAVAAVRRAVADVQKRYPTVHAGVTGGPALDVDEEASLRADMGLASLLLVVGVALLLFALFGGFVMPLLGLLALNLGVVWAFAFAAATVGHLNIISATLAPMLIGLGMDYGIHLFSRYEQEIRVRSAAALNRATCEVLRPLVATALSVAITFYGLLLSGVRALEELGLIAGTGVLLVLTSTLVVYPPLLALYYRWRERHGWVEPEARQAVDRPMASFLYRRSGLVLAVCGVVTAFSLLGVPRIGYDFDLLNLQAKGTESVDWELRLLQSAGKSATAYGVVLADSVDEVRRKVRSLEARPTVSEAVSVASIIPEQQEDKIDRIRRMAPLIETLPAGLGAPRRLDPAILRATLVNIRSKMASPGTTDGESAGEKTRVDMIRTREEIQRILESLDEAGAESRLREYQSLLLEDFANKLSTLRDAVRVAPLTILDLPEDLHDRFVGRSGKSI